jgi:hypothetical protein
MKPTLALWENILKALVDANYISYAQSSSISKPSSNREIIPILLT